MGLLYLVQDKLKEANMDWIDKKRPGPPKKPSDEKRKTVHATVHPQVKVFWEEYRQNPNTGTIGKLIDRLISSEFPHVKIGDV